MIDLRHGDCLKVLRGMEADSVDAVVTDPPYGLSFMGKGWDYEVPTEDVWRECLRVLKPGGHLLAFAGTRTQHRMAVRIEDAGFEIRDMIAWVYGSGFPKSMDVSKAIDKMDAAEEQRARRFRFTEWVRSTGIIAAQIDVLTGTRMGGHYLSPASQPAIMTREHLEACRMFLGDIPEWVERDCDIRSVESRNMAARNVVGHKEMRDTSEIRIACTASANGSDSAARRSVAITTPATDAARQWDGWGTALKPALEPITVARKPLVGTVAANVLRHGTGGINVDGCRVNPGEPVPGGGGGERSGRSCGILGAPTTGNLSEPHTSGRWPANLIHDGSDEVVGLTGDAARFFYCAKASKADRDEGLDAGSHRAAGVGDERPSGSSEERRGKNAVQPRANIHPTVKPTALMRYLCRLVTPPNGIVLDPFMGSGSTGKAAILEGFRFLGIEREADYIEIARARIDAAQRKAGLFGVS
jgi:DNA modification methylase